MAEGRLRKKRKLGFEHLLLTLALLVGLPGGLLGLVLLWTGSFEPKTKWTLTLFLGFFWWLLAIGLQNRVIRPLQTLANIVEGLREGDFSLRARGARPFDALGELVLDVNLLAEQLRGRRLDSLEATALLRKVMSEIDVAIFAFDSNQQLRLVNRAGEQLLGRPAASLIGSGAAELQLIDCLKRRAPPVLEREFSGGSGRWQVRRSSFRQGGLPLQMLVLTDLSRALRHEERQAWQRLIRVLGHELNNSLAPIQSVAGSLETLLDRQPRQADWEQDMHQGLKVITSRSAALNRFLEAYARLARLPSPEMKPVNPGKVIRRVVRLETRIPVTLRPGPDITIRADADQLEQLLLNLLRNAVDAVEETGGGIQVGWGTNANHFEVWVEDEGPGLPNTSNLFVPFFSTKPDGSGIGLVLSRQIAEAHEGSLTLENRKSGRGCIARLRIPL